MLQDNIAVRNVNGGLVTNFRKDLWLGLSDLFWLQRLAPQNARAKQTDICLYFQPVIGFHVIKSLYNQVEVSSDLIEGSCEFLAPILKQRMKNLDAMALSSITWSSASLDKFIQMLKDTKDTFQSLTDALNVIASEKGTIDFKKTEEDFLGMVCGSCWSLEDLTEAMCESLHASISEHGKAR